MVAKLPHQSIHPYLTSSCLFDLFWHLFLAPTSLRARIVRTILFMAVYPASGKRHLEWIYQVERSSKSPFQLSPTTLLNINSQAPSLLWTSISHLLEWQMNWMVSVVLLIIGILRKNWKHNYMWLGSISSSKSPRNSFQLDKYLPPNIYKNPEITHIIPVTVFGLWLY